MAKLLRNCQVWRSVAVVFAFIVCIVCARPAAWSDGSGQPAGMTVTVVRAARHCFPDQLKLSGFVVPSEELLVRPETEGFRVSEILVEDGQQVSQDQILAKLVRADDPKSPSIH